MKTGSIVETVGDFESIRKEYSLPYPKKGDVLTVIGITKHPNKDVSKQGIVLLHFAEIPSLPGVCDKQVNGKLNFMELILPDEIEELLKAPLKSVLSS